MDQNIHTRQTHPLVRQDVHKDYDRMGSVQNNKSEVVSLKGLDDKTKRLAVNRQSESNCDFDFSQ
jgi:hypothetical protein